MVPATPMQYAVPDLGLHSYGLKDGDFVAAKVLNTTLNPNDVFADNREALLLSELAHQNVVKFFGICHTEQVRLACWGRLRMLPVIVVLLRLVACGVALELAASGAV